MADDNNTERRLQSVMEKLFHTPKHSSSSSSRVSSLPSAQTGRGIKRPHSMLMSKSKWYSSERDQNVLEQVVPCRPWDRGDLMKRLATFKSMTWFAKPKVVDAVNCARRGWINVDTDVISCEVCGARLLFTTPASWNQQQVEKAASVFSLKLDNGHKLLCPWFDNCCDETLALFPPTPSEVLVERYRERSSSLLKLSALPLISSSTIGSMKSPQLKMFLRQSISVEYGKGPDGSSWTELLGSECETVSTASYYQAHRLLSLCGWEPRLLPYIVDCNEGQKHSTIPGSGVELNNNLSVYSSWEKSAIDEESVASDIKYDPNSVVLDCKLCGASVGLWTFVLVSKPLEFVRVVGYGEVDSRINLGNDNPGNGHHPQMPKSKMTIAGGPLPAQQNFRATISVPVISRNLRARFSYVSSVGSNASELSLVSSPSSEVAKETSQDVEAASVLGDKSSHAMEDAGKSNQTDSELSVQESSDCFKESDPNVVSEIGEVGSGSHLQLMERNEMASTEHMLAASRASQNDANVGNAVQSTVNIIDKDSRQAKSRNIMEFDVLRQHRHFCPWVASTETICPGWKQTLMALKKDKVFTITESEDSPVSPFLIKVDDPITSIRRLFKSPSTKAKAKNATCPRTS